MKIILFSQNILTGECYLAFTAKISIVYFLAAASNGNAPDDNIVKETSDRSFMDNPRLRFGLESMLQESMYHKPLGMEARWSTGLNPNDSITRSSEFQPMPRVAKKHVMDSSIGSSITDKDVTPTINVKLARYKHKFYFLSFASSAIAINILCGKNLKIFNPDFYLVVKKNCNFR